MAIAAETPAPPSQSAEHPASPVGQSAASRPDTSQKGAPVSLAGLIGPRLPALTGREVLAESGVAFGLGLLLAMGAALVLRLVSDPVPSARQRLRRAVVDSRSLALADRARALATAASDLAGLCGEGTVSLAMPHGADRLDRVLGQCVFSAGTPASLGSHVMRAVYGGDASGLRSADLDLLESALLNRLGLLKGKR